VNLEKSGKRLRPSSEILCFLRYLLFDCILPPKASHPLHRAQRVRDDRFKCFTYDELVKRDKVNLDIFWLKDESLEESANLPAPEVIAAEIAADLEAALEQFATIAEDVKP